ncbi:MAG: TIGR00159 family protein, partial [Thermoplasmata archaeon]
MHKFLLWIANNWKILIEIVILWFVFYKILLFLKGTRAVHLLRGIIFLVIAFLIFQKVGFNTLNWLFTKLFAISVIGLLVIFQPELRQGLAKLGQQQLFHFLLPEEDIEEISKEIALASSILSRKKIGALIAIQREVGLKNYAESGVIIDAHLSSELIQSIFQPLSPLHDGGMIIQEKRIYACGCLFPLSDNPDIDKSLGMRHRAALGLSEETDAVVVCISEETGNI